MLKLYISEEENLFFVTGHVHSISGGGGLCFYNFQSTATLQGPHANMIYFIRNKKIIFYFITFEQNISNCSLLL